MTPEAGPTASGTAAALFLRRQLVLAAVAGAVVLVAVVVVGAAMAGGHHAGHAALRPSADGSRVIAVSPLPEQSRSAVWVAGGALAAVAAVLALAVVHVCRVARFAVLSRSGGGTFPDDAGTQRPAQEAC